MKTVLFIDLDDTVYQGPLSTAVFPHIFKEFRKHKPELTDEGLLAEMIEILEDRFKDWRVDAFDWDELIYITALKYKVPIDVSVEALIKEYSNPPHIRVFDHVVPALKHLKETGNRILAITTNGYWKYQEPIVKALGLRDYFDFVCAPDIMQCLKGQKRFYQHILDGSQIQICIGDRYDSDVEFPKKLGFKSIWIPPDIPSDIDLSLSPFERAKQVNAPIPFSEIPDALLKDFSEVVATVETIEKQALSSLK